MLPSKQGGVASRGVEWVLCVCSRLGGAAGAIGALAPTAVFEVVNLSMEGEHSSILFFF